MVRRESLQRVVDRLKKHRIFLGFRAESKPRKELTIFLFKNPALGFPSLVSGGQINKTI